LAKSSQTWNKKEREKQKQKDRQEKEARKKERKDNAQSGKSLDQMMAYIDENGNITDTPPDPAKRREVNVEDIVIGVPKQAPIDPADLIRTGVVTFFNDAKGYGFIRDLQTQESVFVHINSLQEQVKENMKVTFEVEMGPKGPAAVRVKKAV
jgi:cold shock CspA family protein